ncbi:hypothetical protein CcCBS67573_g01195 [Chytriomyces confervae]|uniref:Uncharacterized protein n=1 Tax=Chytriomyces confervae TaxID=246404 RepID=A0A507FMI5_9FUNG|nr:hypothetical protein CcCBS67573_g01195 [Chytriomyces confervae]
MNQQSIEKVWKETGDGIMLVAELRIVPLLFGGKSIESLQPYRLTDMFLFL